LTFETYAERLTAVRQRFAITLHARLETIEAALPRLAGTGRDTAAAVAAAHHQVHVLCGLAPTVGFSRIGRTARKIERVLLEPFRSGRGLTRHEVEQVQNSLDILRAEAKIELNDAQVRGAQQAVEN
jgi:chemotaxis protein histidine kinase CheA